MSNHYFRIPQKSQNSQTKLILKEGNKNNHSFNPARPRRGTTHKPCPTRKEQGETINSFNELQFIPFHNQLKILMQDI